MRESYRTWTRSLPEADGDLQSVMSLEERKDDAIAAALGRHHDELGERLLRATSAGIDLRKIVRQSTLPYHETWPEESWYQIGRMLAENELCNVAIIHYLATGEGKEAIWKLWQLGGSSMRWRLTGRPATMGRTSPSWKTSPSDTDPNVADWDTRRKSNGYRAIVALYGRCPLVRRGRNHLRLPYEDQRGHVYLYRMFLWST